MANDVIKLQKFHCRYRHYKKNRVNYSDMKEGSIGCLVYELSEHFYTL